jgi:hypothetical protein
LKPDNALVAVLAFAYANGHVRLADGLLPAASPQGVLLGDVDGQTALAQVA